MGVSSSFRRAMAKKYSGIARNTKKVGISRNRTTRYTKPASSANVRMRKNGSFVVNISAFGPRKSHEERFDLVLRDVFIT